MVDSYESHFSELQPSTQSNLVNTSFQKCSEFVANFCRWKYWLRYFQKDKRVVEQMYCGNKKKKNINKYYYIQI